MSVETKCASIAGPGLPQVLQGRPGVLVTEDGKDPADGEMIAVVFRVSLADAQTILPIEEEEGFPFVEIHIGPQGEVLLAVCCA